MRERRERVCEREERECEREERESVRERRESVRGSVRGSVQTCGGRCVERTDRRE